MFAKPLSDSGLVSGIQKELSILNDKNTQILSNNKELSSLKKSNKNTCAKDLNIYFTK